MGARLRIYTEDKPEIRKLIVESLEAATLFFGSGLWRGSMEKSLIVEIIGEDKAALAKLAESLAKLIKKAGKQEAVLYTVEDMAEAKII